MATKKRENYNKNHPRGKKRGGLVHHVRGKTTTIRPYRSHAEKGIID